MMVRALLMAALAASLALAAPRKTLDLYFIDVEGGQATLLVTPAGESLLIDAGWPGNNGRDPGRITAAARKAGLDHIDYLIVTHHHLDHVGGVPELMDAFPVKTVADHGASVETTRQAVELSQRYEAAVNKHGAKRLQLKPGDKIPLKGVNVTVLTAAGGKCANTFKGSGPNPVCGQEEKKAYDPSENAQSAGVLVEYGKFRFIDLGDLTWNKEIELMCPVNPVGRVDLYLTTHHGLDASGSKTIVHALAPRVAVMNNGARKGGSAAAWQVVSSSPGLKDLWQLHYAVAGGKDNNVAEERIANLDEKCQGQWIEVSASNNGEMTVLNTRNGYKKTYKP